MWRWTLDGPTPPGAVTAQLDGALEELRRPLPERLKLYNASNFFDRRAVPPPDLPRIAELAEPFRAVTVESHASMVGPEALEFSALIAGRLEIAIGLETIHPVAIAHLNKRLELARFDRAAEFLGAHRIDLRVFVLLGTPYVPAPESIDWTIRTVEYAAARGASRIAIIPVRGGNGELERLQATGAFTPPTLAQLEEALERCLASGSAAVSADLWDVAHLPGCASCRDARIARMRRMNVTGHVEARIHCRVCA
ncbi:MAG TPA: radical SAM protein [Casimicrobiaceae bacterium]|nr:radical SAM protein [Casimicrobiaceae bacterium]